MRGYSPIMQCGNPSPARLEANVHRFVNSSFFSVFSVCHFRESGNQVAYGKSGFQLSLE